MKNNEKNVRTTRGGIFFDSHCTLQLTVSHRSDAFDYSGADRENLTALHRLRPLTWIDMLYSYRTGPVKLQQMLKLVTFAIASTARYESIERHLHNFSNILHKKQSPCLA